MSTSTGENALRQLVAGVEAAVAAGGGEEAVTVAVAEVVQAALATGLSLDPALTVPDPDHYVMYPLHVAGDGGFSIAAAVWNVGQFTPVHDHGVWGVVGIHSGVEGEVRYARTDAGPLRRLADAEWSPGQVTICCTTDQDLHQVSCASDVPCVGIHVYGGDIGTIQRRSYDPDSGAVSYFVSSWAQPNTIGR